MWFLPFLALLLHLQAFTLASSLAQQSLSSRAGSTHERETVVQPVAYLNIDPQAAVTIDRAALANDPQPGGLYYCEEENYQGACNWLGPDFTKQCMRLEYKVHYETTDTWATEVPKSINPDEGGHCDLYKSDGKGKTCNYRTWVDSVNSGGEANGQLPDYDWISCCPGDKACPFSQGG